MNEHLQGRQHHALEVLHDAGAHLVICKRDKTPIWNGWQHRMPPLDVVQEHDGPLGIIPYSIGSSALDVDIGDWRKMPRPWVNYGTRRKGGRHLFYGDDVARGNSTWAAEDCSGEVRGAKGYLVLWKDGAERLAAAITGARQLELFPFPAELIQEFEPGRLIQFPERPLNPSRSIHLERVQVGARNDSLFDVVRKMSYQELTFYRKAGGHLRGWLRLVYDFTDDNNRRFPVPLERDDVRSVAYSVATWVWSWGYDHSPEKQAARAIEGMRQRREANEERDKAIVQAVSEGRSLRDVAREYRLTVGGVQWILSRGVW